jgi:hypothetical protein
MTTFKPTSAALSDDIDLANSRNKERSSCGIRRLAPCLYVLKPGVGSTTNHPTRLSSPISLAHSHDERDV